MSQTANAPKAPEPEVADIVADEPVPQKINWGGVVKGALIVTAVVVVGFVGFHVLSGMAGAIIAKSAVAKGAVAGIGGVATWAVGVAGNAWGAITGGAYQLSTSIGLQPFIDSGVSKVTAMFSPSALTTAGKATATKIAGWLGAGVAVSTALPLAKAALSNTHLIVPDTSAMLPPDALPPDAMVGHAAVKSVNAHHAADAAHQQSTLGKLGHHAAEDHDSKPAAGSWQAKVGERPSAASHAERVTQDAAASKLATPSMA